MKKHDFVKSKNGESLDFEPLCSPTVKDAGSDDSFPYKGER